MNPGFPLTLNGGYFIFKFRATPSFKFNKIFFSVLMITKISIMNQIAPAAKNLRWGANL
jgi:hypothetical protein